VSLIGQLRILPAIEKPPGWSRWGRGKRQDQTPCPTPCPRPPAR